MAVDRTRYRQLEFIGERILQARELNWIQEMDENVFVMDDETPVSGILQTIYRQGATFNVAVSTVGLNVTINPIDSSIPMYIFVRDRWEIFPSQNDDCTDFVNGTVAGNSTMTLIGSQNTVYLNWELRIRTGGLIGDDPVLTDTLTNEATANAGELILHLNVVDTSGAPLGTDQLATNTASIPLFVFTNNSTSLTLIRTDNIQNQALATEFTSGLVKTTTNTPVVVSTDDPRLGSAGSLADGSVHDSTVRIPTPFGGVNSNGTTVYRLPEDGGSDIGGLSAAKVVLLATTQALEDGWNWLVNSFNSLQNAFNSHYTASLGLANTHPVPTASQVGAAPLSHVGLPLGLSTSHQPVVNANSGGFRTNQSASGAKNDPAFGVYFNSLNIASLNHDGDVYGNLADAYVASPGGTGITVTGSLGYLSTVAGVLSQHVNQVSHCNPHGLTASDLGALSSSGIASLFSGNGYIQIPSSSGTLIIQWGFGSGLHNGSVITYPIPFPHAAFVVIPQGIGGSVNVSSIGTSNFTINVATSTAYYIAIGH